MDRRTPGASVLAPANLPPRKLLAQRALLASTARRLTAAETLAADARAAALDETYRATYLPLLSRKARPGYVDAAVPEWARARYERETTR